MILAFNDPRSLSDVQQILFLALHQALRGNVAVVSDHGDMVGIQWGEDVPVENGYVLYLTTEQYLDYRKAIEQEGK